MQTIKDFITLASTQLNDQRYNRAFNRWGRGLLLQYLNLGLSELAAYFPKDFTATVSLTLKSGKNQIADISGDLISIDSNEDGSKVNSMDSDMSDAFSAYSFCAPDITFINGDPRYRIISYAINNKTPKQFIVEPPVPDGMTPKVNAIVGGQAVQYTLENWNDELDVPQKYVSSLMEFVLGSALGLNTESPLSRAESAAHFTRFYSVLGINYKQSSRFKSGYYEGQRGDGDLRVVRP